MLSTFKRKSCLYLEGKENTIITRKEPGPPKSLLVYLCKFVFQSDKALLWPQCPTLTLGDFLPVLAMEWWWFNYCKYSLPSLLHFLLELERAMANYSETGALDPFHISIHKTILSGRTIMDPIFQITNWGWEDEKTDSCFTQSIGRRIIILWWRKTACQHLSTRAWTRHCLYKPGWK